MTRDDIIRMAREAGMPSLSLIDIGYLEKFAALVAAAEREARAKVCDSLASPSRLSDPSRSWITEHWIALQPSEQGVKHDNPPSI